MAIGSDDDARGGAGTATGEPGAVAARESNAPGLCRACRARGERGIPDGVYALLAGCAASGSARGAGGDWQGAVAHYLGLLAATTGALDLAAAQFEAALRAAGPASTSALGAWAQLAYARVLLARAAPGDAVRAGRLLEDLLARAPVAGQGVPVPARVPAVAERRGSERYMLRREGEYWALASAGAVSRARGLRGFDYMAELLRRPHQPVYVIDLMRPVSAPATWSAADAAEQGLRVRGGEGGGVQIDRRARDEYRRRWGELLAERAAAERDHDPGRAARVQCEIDMLARELAAGTSRRGMPSAQERARVNVRNCVSSALRVIRRHDEPLWRHLANAIKTGTFCVYEPDRPVEWEL